MGRLRREWAAMDSSGRGEDSPEAYRGVVIPAGHQPAQVQQPQSYGEHVQPAGGSPWGAPEQAQEPADATQMLPPYPGAHPQGLPAPAARPAAPAAPIADATQMLPPYPGAHPQGLPAAPIADATQMLPPYPGGNPAGHLPPQPGPQSAGLPPRPPIPPQAPPGGHAPEPPAAEATQALPLLQGPARPGPARRPRLRPAAAVRAAGRLRAAGLRRPGRRPAVLR